MYSEDVGAAFVLDYMYRPQKSVAIFAPTLLVAQRLAASIVAKSRGAVPVEWDFSRRTLTWPTMESRLNLFSVLEPESWRGIDLHFGWAVGIGEWHTGYQNDHVLQSMQMVVRKPEAHFLATY